MRRDIPVRLTAMEVQMAAMVGAARYMESVENNRKDAHGYPCDRDGLSDHILGACGEAAVARVLGRYWGGDVGSFKRADIGRSLQIKTRSRHDYDLLIRPDDNPEHVFVLVTGLAPDFVVRGWYLARHAMGRPELSQTHGGRPPAWFVPQAELRGFPD